MSRPSQRRSSSSNVRVALFVLICALFLVICFCIAAYAAIASLFDGEEATTPEPQAALTVAYSPEKELAFTTLVDNFNAQGLESPDGEPMRIEAIKLDPEAMMDAALDLNPDARSWASLSSAVH